MPTMATPYPMGLPVPINGITNSDHGRQAANPISMIRRRPKRSQSVADVATDAMLVNPPSTPMDKMRLREYPR